MKKQIAIIELCSFTHYSSVLSRIDIFQDEDVEITVFLERDVHECMKSEIAERNVDVRVREKDQKLWSFMQSVSNTYFDQIHVTSLQSKPHLFLLFKPNTDKLYVHVHNVNSWFEGLRLSGFKDVFMQLVRKIWLQQVTGITVGLPAMKDAVRNFEFEKPVICVPFTLHYPERVKKIREGIDEFKNQKRLKIGIPGTVTQGRRDYIGSLNALAELPKDIKKQLTVEFIGPFIDDQYKKIIQQKVKKVQDSSLKLITHQERLSQDEFNRSLFSADILYGPCIIQNGNEIYGVTKDLGLPSDMLKSGLPGIIPSELNIRDELEPGVIRYSDYNDLQGILKKLTGDEGKLSDIKNSVKKCVHKFTPETYRKRLSINNF